MCLCPCSHAQHGLLGSVSAWQWSPQSAGKLPQLHAMRTMSCTPVGFTTLSHHLPQSPKGWRSSCCQAAPVPSLCSLSAHPYFSSQTHYTLIHGHSVTTSPSFYPQSFCSHLSLLWVCFSPLASVPHLPEQGLLTPSHGHLKSPDDQ